MAAGLCVLALHGLVIWAFAAEFNLKDILVRAPVVQVVLLPRPILPDPAPAPAPRLIAQPAIVAIQPRFTVTPPPDAIRATEPVSSPPAIVSAGASKTGTGTAPAPPAPPPDYLSRLVAHLNSFKNYPYDARVHREEGTVRLRFIIDRGGHVLFSGIAGSSGHASLDTEARQMIQRADPFPPMPSEYHGDRLDLVVPLVFSLH